jgi:hypothetical protein
MQLSDEELEGVTGGTGTLTSRYNCKAYWTGGEVDNLVFTTTDDF